MSDSNLSPLKERTFEQVAPGTGGQEFGEIADRYPDPIIAHVKGQLIFINQAGRMLLHVEDGARPSDIHLERFVTENSRHQLVTHKFGLLSTQLRSQSGKVLHVEITATPLTMYRQRATVLAVRDVSHRLMSESALLDAENRQQEHLAFDLHDSVGQQLTGISLLLEALSKAAVPSVPALKDDFRTLADLVAKTISDIRILAGSLSPITVERVGLAGGLKILQEKAENIYGLNTRLALQPASGWILPTYDANHLFRIVQEAISNVARHARAAQLSIDARVDRGDLAITVSDDGIGITEAAFSATGLGLRSMRYRAERIGGRLEIQRGLPVGTAVRIIYPLQTSRTTE